MGKMIVPDLSNISGSAHYYNKTDGGLAVYRDFERGIVEVHINKIKFKHLGKIGMVRYSYNIKNGRYEEQKGISDAWDDSNWLNKNEQITMNMSPNVDFDNDVKRDVFKPEEDNDLPF